MTNKANVYPKNGNNPTITNSDSSRANLGFCFSGGGSRALTCAWGQLLGLHTLSLVEKARYISSVSGGTWASSIYTFLPSHITDENLLGRYFSPDQLSLSGDDKTFNVNNLGEYSLGKAPAGTSLEALTEWSTRFLLLHSESKYKWLWASTVANFILEPFGLRSEGKKLWSSSKYFTLSESYANENFPEGAPSTSDFYFARQGRPFIIMNDNLMNRVKIDGTSDSNIVQLPNQATAVSTGVSGETPNRDIIGNGSVDSYAYNSTLEQVSAGQSPVTVTIKQPYSLIDSVSTSSAFFANAIASHIEASVNHPKTRKSLANQLRENLEEEHQKKLLANLKEDITDIGDVIEKSLQNIVSKKHDFLGSLIPRYNYWPIGEVSANTETPYTDGGTLDNTGVIGILSQTDTGSSTQDPIFLVVFDNTSTPLEKIKGNIIAGSQAAPLFGIDFDTSTGKYQPYSKTQRDPKKQDFKATSLISVFENTAYSDNKTPFDRLVDGLYSSNCGSQPGESPDDNKLNSEPAFYQMSLTTISNSLANISAGRTVNVLYIQNAKTLTWQNQIGDSELKKQIEEGQKYSIDPFLAFKDFPYYSTFLKIGLEAKESNVLSQMWAWSIADDQSSLKTVLQNFIRNAT